MKDWTTLDIVPTLDWQKPGNSYLVSDGAWGSVVPESMYTFNGTYDLGAIFETRISSMIQAHAEINPPGPIDPDDWDLWLEVRTADNPIMIASWVTMASIDPIAQGGAAFGEWRPVQTGAQTGRMFQFRIQVRSYNPNVKVVITDPTVVLDMPDMWLEFSDLLVPAVGKRVVFDPQFYGLKAVAVTIDGNTNQVVANITNKSKTGFDLSLRDVLNGTDVSGQCDIIAAGFGRGATAPI
jgi:hypothetical protein